MRLQYYVDSEGRKRCAQAVLSDWKPIATLDGDHLSRYLVCIVGYVLLEQSDRLLKVIINFDAVSEAACAALCYELADLHQNTSQPVFVVDGEKTVFRFGGGGPAITFIASRMHDRRPMPPLSSDR